MDVHNGQEDLCFNRPYIGEVSFLFNSIHNLVYMLIEYLYVSVWWLVWYTNDYICSYLQFTSV